MLLTYPIHYLPSPAVMNHLPINRKVVKCSRSVDIDCGVAFMKSMKCGTL